MFLLIPFVLFSQLKIADVLEQFRFEGTVIELPDSIKKISRLDELKQSENLIFEYNSSLISDAATLFLNIGNYNEFALYIITNYRSFDNVNSISDHYYFLLVDFDQTKYYFFQNRGFFFGGGPKKGTCFLNFVAIKGITGIVELNSDLSPKREFILGGLGDGIIYIVNKFKKEGSIWYKKVYSFKEYKLEIKEISYLRFNTLPQINNDNGWEKCTRYDNYLAFIFCDKIE